MIDATTVGVIAGLVLLNAVYVAAEFAIVAARQSVLAGRADRGDAAAARVLGVVRDRSRQDRYIATAQLGITVASLGLGMYGEVKLSHAIAAWIGAQDVPGWLASHALAGALAVAILTYFHIVAGEMIPKAVALTSAESVACRLSPIIRATHFLAYPLVASLNGLGNALLRSLRLPRQEAGRAQQHTLKELQYLVRESEEVGLLRPEAADVVEELVDFGELTAGEVMVPRVHIQGIEIGCAVDDLRRTLREAPHTRYPVYAGDLDHIVGTVHIKSAFRRIRQGRPLVQSDIHPVPFIPETSTVDKVLAAMRERRVQMAVVMDEHGGTAGILTLEDLFEEVVGEIDDVATGSPPDLVDEREGVVRVAGTVRLDELGDHLGIELEHEDVSTVSGLVLALLERPPQVGDAVEFAELRFEVTAVEGHGADECRVQRVQSTERSST